MAIQPDLVGTITLTSGSTAFTWAGTSLVSANIQPGDQILLPAKAMVLTIATVTSATAGTLTNNCPAGAAGAGQAARIRYQSDLSRVAAQMRELIELLGSGNVSALAALTGAGDRGVHFTGAGVMAMHTLTALGRALAGLTGANGKFPVATGAGAAEMRDIVGTVAQSGGVPTGAIVERGNNANGRYTRFADGTQICWHTASIGPVTSGSGASNDPYKTDPYTWIFPVSFSVDPVPVLSANRNAGTSNARVSYGAYAQNPPSTTALVNIRALAISSTADPIDIYALAIGRWF